MRGNLPAQDWQIDFTHMPTHEKLRYILTFVDTFSGWIEAFPTSRETADMVASILTLEIVPCFGLPATIQSDNSPAFIAQVVQPVAKSLNISWKLHIPYHPQSSGKVERAHGILKDHLAKLTIEGLETHARQHPSSQVAPQNDQWKSKSLGPTHLRLTCGPCLPIPDPSNSPNPSNVSP
ncbi:Pol polyprotein [Plecturocebus cupreus]